MYWNCLCDCGNTKAICITNLRSGDTNSCGCYQRERASDANTVHGDGARKSFEWRVWQGLFKRCYDKNGPSYEAYGGRGLVVCKRWHGYADFLGDMGRSPSDSHSIDRAGRNVGYTCGSCDECLAMEWKANCRWATRLQQAENRITSRLLDFDGRRQCIAAWGRELGITGNTIRARLDKFGWSIEKALTTPVRVHSNNHYKVSTFSNV